MMHKVFLFVLVFTVSISGNAPGWSCCDAEDLAFDAVLPLLEQQIPFDVRISNQPLERCDPLNLHVLITKGEGKDTQFQWLVMDEEEVLMEFLSFEELYYRCDGPGCFIIRFSEVNEATGKTSYITRRHVCLK